MRIKRHADGFTGKIISPSYSWIGFIFNFNDIFIFKFLNLYAQPAFLWGAHASRGEIREDFVDPGPRFNPGFLG
jgi:hypothetical protein